MHDRDPAALGHRRHRLAAMDAYDISAVIGMSRIWDSDMDWLVLVPPEFDVKVATCRMRDRTDLAGGKRPQVSI